MTWAPVRNIVSESDVRAGSAWSDMTLMTVSQTAGVIPRHTVTSDPPRATDLSKYKVCREGDLVLNRFNAYRGALGVAPAAGIVSPDYCVLRVRENANPRYLDYWLRAEPTVNAMLQSMGGIGASDPESSGFSRVNIRSLMREKILEGSVHGQNLIADFLDRETAKIDAVIEKQRALVGGLRERRSVVIFNGATGTEARARSELTDWFGQPPRHWEVDKLGRRARIGNGSTPNSSTPAYWEGGTIPWLNSSVVNTGFVMEPSRLVTEVATRECHLPIVRAGAILMAITGQGKTRGMVAELGIDSTINQHLAFINPDPDYWHVPYLVLLLRAAYGELRRISEESGSTKGALTCSGISAFKVPRPPLEEQRAIAVRLDQETAKIDALIAKSERLIELSHERRAALITAAVTGQINITTDTKALEGAA